MTEPSADATQGALRRWHLWFSGSWPGVLAYWVVMPAVLVPSWFVFAAVTTGWNSGLLLMAGIILLIWMVVVSVAAVGYGVVIVVCRFDPL